MNKHPHAKSEVRAEQAAGNKYQLIKLGLDVHADSIVVVRIIENSAPQPAQRFAPGDFRQAEQVHSCYEAGPFGFVLHRQLVALGVRNLVMQPVGLDEQRKNVNHDKSDALALAQRLDRYVAGNTRALAIVRVPTPEQEQKRIHTRQREQLKREVLRVGAQGRSLLLSQGYREKKGWWEPKRWLALQEQLPDWLMERLATIDGKLPAIPAYVVASAPVATPSDFCPSPNTATCACARP
jgi:transposase